ncbi:MAG TPA: EamA family transporter [Alphaproteobacteria bacterium]|nr:EamA family transporter [Alphaproteobacteria bacterium]
MMSLRAWIYLLLLSSFWGASFYFIEVGLEHLSPVWLVSLRLISGAICLCAWLTITSVSLPYQLAFWRDCLVMGVLNNLAPFCLIAWGQLSVTGGMASILNANTAFIGVLVSALFLKTEPLRVNRVAGVIIGVSGVAVAIGVNPLSGETGSVWGQLAIVLATLFYALAGVWGRVRLSSYQAVQGACGMLLCSAVLSVPLALLLSGQPSVSLLQSAHLGTLVVLILGIGLLGTAMAYPLYFKVLELAGASNLLLVTIIVPVFALSLDALLLGQLVSWSAMAGFGLVAFGLSVMDGRLYHRKDSSDSR